MNKLSIPIAIALIVLASCGKDNSTPTPNPEPGKPNQTDSSTCKPISVDLSTDFDLSDTSPYSYSIVYNGTVIQTLNRSVGATTYAYTYNGSLPVKRDKLVSSIVKATDSFFFSGSTVGEMRHYENGTLYDAVKYQYSGNSLSKKEFVDYGTTTTTAYNQYTVAGNLISKVERYTSGGTLYDSYTYTYGTQQNKLLKQNNLIDLYLHMDEDLESVIYDGLLNNDVLMNTIAYTETGKASVTYNMTYDLNTNGYPVAVKANGKTIITFNYDCK